MKRRTFNKAMVLTAGAIAVPSWVGETQAAALFVKEGSRSRAPTSVYRLNGSDFPNAGLTHTFTQANHADNYGAGTEGTQVSWDATEEAVKMTMPSEAGQNGCGEISWENLWTPGTSDFPTFAWRMRVDQAFIDGGGYPEDPGGSYSEFPKLAILFEGASCGSNELTPTNKQYRGYLHFYRSCAGGGGQQYGFGSDIDRQPGGNTAASHQQDPSGGGMTDLELPEWKFFADEWFWLVFQVDMANDHLHAYAKYDNDVSGLDSQTYGPLDDSWYKVVSHAYPRDENVDNTTDNPDKLDSIFLTIYTTSKNASVVHTPWNVWYQDILATKDDTAADVRSVFEIPTAISDLGPNLP